MSKNGGSTTLITDDGRAWSSFEEGWELVERKTAFAPARVVANGAAEAKATIKKRITDKRPALGGVCMTGQPFLRLLWVAGASQICATKNHAQCT